MLILFKWSGMFILFVLFCSSYIHRFGKIDKANPVKVTRSVFIFSHVHYNNIVGVIACWQPVYVHVQLSHRLIQFTISLMLLSGSLFLTAGDWIPHQQSLTSVTYDTNESASENVMLRVHAMPHSCALQLAYILFCHMTVLAGNPQRPDVTSASARVPKQPPTPSTAAALAAAACAPAACHDDADSRHQHAQRGRRSDADTHGQHQPAAAAGQLAAVPLSSSQLWYWPAFSPSSSWLVQPLHLPSLPQPTAG